MFDLHCHILPGIDDGAPDLATALEMAKVFRAEGVEAVACTPHILPGVYHNSGPQIRAACATLQNALDEAGTGLRLFTGADNHIVPDMAGKLRDGHLLSLADSRYVLVEPPHHVAPAGIEDLFFSLLVQGYVPILTHPERLSWIKDRYAVVSNLAARGVWMQITAGSLSGAFGRTAQYWGERMLDEGMVHILASDAHDTRRRPPDLGRGRQLAARRLGEAEADNLTLHRPRGILANEPPSALPPLPNPAGRPISPPPDGGQRRSQPNRGGMRGIAGRVRRIFG